MPTAVAKLPTEKIFAEVTEERRPEAVQTSVQVRNSYPCKVHPRPHPSAYNEGNASLMRREFRGQARNQHQWQDLGCYMPLAQGFSY